MPRNVGNKLWTNDVLALSLENATLAHYSEYENCHACASLKEQMMSTVTLVKLCFWSSIYQRGNIYVRATKQLAYAFCVEHMRNPVTG